MQQWNIRTIFSHFLFILLAAVCGLVGAYVGNLIARLKQKSVALELEHIVDEIYGELLGCSEDWIPWRIAGVYKFAVCTDSVFGGRPLSENFKDEPDYLDAFRHLAHSPGRYCLGPQEDPNHLEETVVSGSRRYGLVQKGLATDVFMDDPISAFQVHTFGCNDCFK